MCIYIYIGLAPERLAILDHPPTSNVCPTTKSMELGKHEVLVDMHTVLFQDKSHANHQTVDSLAVD